MSFERRELLREKSVQRYSLPTYTKGAYVAKGGKGEYAPGRSKKCSRLGQILPAAVGGRKLNFYRKMANFPPRSFPPLEVYYAQMADSSPTYAWGKRLTRYNNLPCTQSTDRARAADECRARHMLPASMACRTRW